MNERDDNFKVPKFSLGGNVVIRPLPDKLGIGEKSLPQPHPPSESDVAAAEKWCKSEYNLEPKDSPRIYAKLIQPSFLAGCEFKAAEKDKVIGELRAAWKMDVKEKICLQQEVFELRAKLLEPQDMVVSLDRARELAIRIAANTHESGTHVDALELQSALQKHKPAKEG
jgi:hypothetical protein